MKPTESILCIFFVIFFVNCRNQQLKTNNTLGNNDTCVEMKIPIEINTIKDYEKKPLILEEIADIEYIPLETNQQVLLSNFLNGLSISDSLLITINRENTVFIFSRSGHLISQFNHTGRGPNEYQSILKIAVDFKMKEIYIYDYSLRYKILVYSMTGDFKRSFNVPVSLFVNDLTDYDENYLLAYITALVPIKGEKGTFRPYYLMSKKSGTLKQLDIKVSEIKNGKIYKSYMVGGHNRARMIGFRTSPIIKNGSDFFISDFACDTIYSFNNNTTSPFIVNKPSLQNMEKPIFVGISLKTTRYTFLSVVDIEEETMEVNRKFIGINHKTGEIFEPVFYNSHFEQVLENYFHNLSPEYSAISIPAFELVQLYEKGKLTGKLKKIASDIKEDDNPVVMLVKFKK